MKAINQYIVRVNDRLRILYECEYKKYYITDIYNSEIIPLPETEAMKLIPLYYATPKL